MTQTIPITLTYCITGTFAGTVGPEGSAPPTTFYAVDNAVFCYNGIANDPTRSPNLMQFFNESVPDPAQPTGYQNVAAVQYAQTREGSIFSFQFVPGGTKYYQLHANNALYVFPRDAIYHYP
jgi:hypothetical protein